MNRVFVEKLTLQARVGIHPHERAAPQELVVSIDAAVSTDSAAAQIDEVVCYENLVAQVKEIIAAQHYELLEVLAEKIADRLLADGRISHLRLRLEKPQAIAEVATVGIEIERPPAI